MKSQFSYGREFDPSQLKHLVTAFSKMKNKKEIVALLQDLLTDQELEQITRRLFAAQMLSSGKTYEEVKKDLKMSNTTINIVYKRFKNSKGGFKKLFG
jgi:TrpR-related protein YerC/YecD